MWSCTLRQRAREFSLSWRGTWIFAQRPSGTWIFTQAKGHVDFHSETLGTWRYTLSQNGIWSITLRPRGTWSFTLRPRGTSGFTQNKGHAKFHFVTKQHVIFESETRGMLVSSVRTINEVYILFEPVLNLNLALEHCAVHFSSLRIVWCDSSQKY
jgi:hypothetical protein